MKKMFNYFGGKFFAPTNRPCCCKLKTVCFANWLASKNETILS